MRKTDFGLTTSTMWLIYDLISKTVDNVRGTYTSGKTKADTLLI